MILYDVFSQFEPKQKTYFFEKDPSKTFPSIYFGGRYFESMSPAFFSRKISPVNETIINEIKGLNINEYTKPITIPGGFLIVKLEKKKGKN